MRARVCLAVLVCLSTTRTARSYSRVSSNGQARAAQDVEFTVSPIHNVVPSVELRPGEAIDHPQLAVSYEDPSSSARGRFQDRFVPSANFPSRNSGKQLAASNVDAIYSKPPAQVIGMTYDYPPSSFASGNSKPMTKPMMSGGDSLPVYPPLKIPSYSSGPLVESSPPQLSKPPRYEPERPPKAIEYDRPPNVIEFPGHYEHPFDFHHDEEVIYDHIPDDYFHHHHHHHKLRVTTTTEQPMDQRLDKRPYSYYYIGRKLWYVPLYFSIYFIIYIALLVLKSVARHKINFPAALAAAAATNGNARSSEPGWMAYLGMVLDSIETYSNLRRM